MSPQLTGPEIERSGRQIDQIRKQRTGEEKPDIDLRVPKHPSEEPQRPSEMEEEHDLGDEQAATMDTAREVVSERCILFGSGQRHVAATADAVIIGSDRHTLLESPQLLVEL